MSKRNVDIHIKLGTRIREMRKSKGWSQEKLGQEADLHRTYISSIERGEVNVSLANIVAIANALDVAMIDLFMDQQK